MSSYEVEFNGSGARVTREALEAQTRLRWKAYLSAKAEAIQARREWEASAETLKHLMRVINRVEGR